MRGPLLLFQYSLCLHVATNQTLAYYNYCENCETDHSSSIIQERLSIKIQIFNFSYVK